MGDEMKIKGVHAPADLLAARVAHVTETRMGLKDVQSKSASTTSLPSSGMTYGSGPEGKSRKKLSETQTILADKILISQAARPREQALSRINSAGQPHSFAAHLFGRSSTISGRCSVCDKKIVPMLTDNSQCIYCGFCVHEDCWNKIFMLPTALGGAVAPMEVCGGPGPACTKANLPFTRSSLYLVKSRLDVESYAPGLDDPVFRKLIKSYTEYANSLQKQLKERPMRLLYENDLIVGFTRILIGNIKRSEEQGRDLGEAWSLYYQKFKALFYDNEWYASVHLDVTKIVPNDMASEMMLEDATLFRAIPPEEFYNTAFTKKDKHQRAPHIMAFIARFNHVSQFVINEILQRSSPKERAAIISYFIEVAQCCQSKRNFNSMKAIISGLMGASVFRLKKSWNLLLKERRHKLDEMARLMSEESNSEKYREVLNAAKLPCVPFLGVFLTDITYIEVAFASQPELVRQKTKEVVTHIQTYQSKPCGLSHIYALDTHMKSLKVDEVDEKTLFDISLRLEPKESISVQTARLETARQRFGLSVEDLAKLPPDKVHEIRNECEAQIARLTSEQRGDPERQPEAAQQVAKLEEIIGLLSNLDSPLAPAKGCTIMSTWEPGAQASVGSAVYPLSNSPSSKSMVTIHGSWPSHEPSIARPIPKGHHRSHSSMAALNLPYTGATAQQHKTSPTQPERPPKMGPALDAQAIIAGLKPAGRGLPREDVEMTGDVAPAHVKHPEGSPLPARSYSEANVPPALPPKLSRGQPLPPLQWAGSVAGAAAYFEATSTPSPKPHCNESATWQPSPGALVARATQQLASSMYPSGAATATGRDGWPSRQAPNAPHTAPPLRTDQPFQWPKERPGDTRAKATVGTGAGVAPTPVPRPRDDRLELAPQANLSRGMGRREKEQLWFYLQQMAARNQRLVELVEHSPEGKQLARAQTDAFEAVFALFCT